MKINFCSLSSGSSGNAHYIGTDNIEILVDAGMSGKRIENLLKERDLRAEDLDALLVTHEHTDHVKGIGVLSRRYNIPIYANKGTWKGMEDKIGKIKEENINIIETEKEFILKDLCIKPVEIYHDAREPVGYIISNDNKKISIVTDTGRLDDRIMCAMEDSDIYLLETNHDIQMLRQGNYPYYLKERVLSDYGHLSNAYASNALSHLLKADGETVFLGHLSQDNNTPRMAFNEVAFKIMELGIDIKKDIKLELTYRNKQTDIITI